MSHQRRLRFNWACLAPLVAGVAALAAALWMGKAWFRLTELNDHGITVRALVDEKKEISGGRYGPSYQVHYHFMAADGHTYQGSSSVGVAHKYDWDTVGPTVAVKYLAADPSLNRWELDLLGQSKSTLAGVVGLGLLGLLLAATGVVGGFMSRRRYERWMLWGRPD
jgi:hypothetical protein